MGEERVRGPRRGQSTLEYILVLAAILAAVIIGAGVMKTEVGTVITDSGATISSASGKLKTQLGLDTQTK